MSLAPRAHAGPRAKLDRRLLNGSFEESLTGKIVGIDFRNDKLRLHQNISGFSGVQESKDTAGCAVVASEDGGGVLRELAGSGGIEGMVDGMDEGVGVWGENCAA